MAGKGASVIIIGAGLSGLCAAKLLKEQCVEVIVLEANSRVGGRLYTKWTDDVGYVDVGGSYVGPTQDRVFRLAKEMGVETYPVYDQGDQLYYRKGKSHRHDLFSPMGSASGMLDINNMYRELDKLLSSVPLDRPWLAKEAAQLDEMSAQEWFNKTIWTESAMREAQLFCRLNFATEARALSLLWLLWCVRQAGGSTRINSTTGGAQERKFIGGSQLLCDKIAKQLRDIVICNSPVIAIDQDGRGVSVETAKKEIFYGSHVILAVSPTLQGRIHFRPPLPPKRAQLLQRVPMGSVIKTITYYKEPYWRKNGLSGTMFTVDEDLSLPVGGTMDDCKPDGSYPAIMGFILADKALKLSHLTRQERRDLIAKQYAKVFHCPEMATPIHYEELDWNAELWSGGCYTGTMGPGVLTNYGTAIREPMGRLYLAGTETATNWAGYMEGAIEAGERAAREVLHDIGLLRQKDIHVKEPPSPDHPAPCLDRTFWENHAPSVPALVRLAVALSSLAVCGTILAKL